MLGHHAQIAVGRADRYKIWDHEVSAGIYEHLRRKAIVRGGAVAPGAAMKVYENRRLQPLSRINVELLDLGRTVGKPLRGTKASAHLFAVAGKSRSELVGDRRVERLIIGGIKLHLIHLHPDARALRVRRRSNVAFPGERRRDGYGGRRAKHRPSSDRAAADLATG